MTKNKEYYCKERVLRNKKMENKIIMILGICLLLSMSLVSAETEIIPLNETISLRFICTLDDAIPSGSTTYNISVSYSNGTAFIDNKATTPLGNGAFSYSTRFTETGLYKVQMFCVDGTSSFSDEGFYDVTPNGQQATIGTSIFYVGLLLILVIFLIGTVVIFMETSNLLAKVGMFGLGYLLLIAITFISWNMAGDFLTSSPFLISMLRILFFVLIIGLFPLVLGGFVWYFLMLFKIKEIDRLMTKGFSFEDAERRTGRKYK